METHPDFQSLDPNVENAEDIYRRVKYGMESQENFKKITIPSLDNDNDDIRIDLKKIDRLYFIEGKQFHHRLYFLPDNNENYYNKTPKHYYLFGRMEKNVYFIMWSWHCFGCSKSEGVIFVSRDPFLLIKIIFSPSYNNYKYNDIKSMIVKSLTKDGIVEKEECSLYFSDIIDRHVEKYYKEKEDVLSMIDKCKKIAKSIDY